MVIKGKIMQDLGKEKKQKTFFEKEKYQKYDEIYKKDVLPILEAYEPLRIHILRKFRILSFIMSVVSYSLFILCIVFILCCFLAIDTAIIFFEVAAVVYLLALCCLIFFFSPAIKIKDESRKYTNMVKRKCLQNLLKVFGNVKWIGHDVGKENLNNVLLTDEQLKKSGLFVNYNTRYTDDEFEGTYRGVPFKISETELWYASSKSAFPAFKGIILSFKFNKKIKNRTIVATKGDFTKKNQILATVIIFLQPCLFYLIKHDFSRGWLIFCLVLLAFILWISILAAKSEESLDEVLLEDPRFGKKFNVYSSDQVEARYLVTPAFMERFYNLKTAFGAKNAKCSFVGDTLTIAIKTSKNLFEICSIDKSLYDPSSINEFYHEIDSIYQMIDYFKLDHKIG